METLTKISPIDKIEFYNSLKEIEGQLEHLVQRFYFFFLQTDAGVLFKKTEMENHYKMFHVTLAFLIAHIDNPAMLNQHLELIVENHRRYGVLGKHIPLFIDSFVLALKEFFPRKDRIIAIWNSVLYEIMSFFNEKLLLKPKNPISSTYKPHNISQGLK